MNTPQLTMNIILLYKDRATCGKLPLHKTSARESCLSKSDGQTARVMDKGRDWVESITQDPGHLLTELLHSLQPVAEMAALFLMSKMKNMP